MHASNAFVVGPSRSNFRLFMHGRIDLEISEGRILGANTSRRRPAVRRRKRCLSNKEALRVYQFVLNGVITGEDSSLDAAAAPFQGRAHLTHRGDILAKS